MIGRPTETVFLAGNWQHANVLRDLTRRRQTIWGTLKTHLLPQIGLHMQRAMQALRTQPPIPVGHFDSRPEQQERLASLHTRADIRAFASRRLPPASRLPAIVAPSIVKVFPGRRIPALPHSQPDCVMPSISMCQAAAVRYRAGNCVPSHNDIQHAVSSTSQIAFAVLCTVRSAIEIITDDLPCSLHLILFQRTHTEETLIGG